jgi:hypothetical protein
MASPVGVTVRLPHVNGARSPKMAVAAIAAGAPMDILARSQSDEGEEGSAEDGSNDTEGEDFGVLLRSSMHFALLSWAGNER